MEKKEKNTPLPPLHKTQQHSWGLPKREHKGKEGFRREEEVKVGGAKRIASGHNTAQQQTPCRAYCMCTHMARIGVGAAPRSQKGPRWTRRRSHRRSGLARVGEVALVIGGQGERHEVDLEPRIHHFRMQRSDGENAVRTAVYENKKQRRRRRRKDTGDDTSGCLIQAPFSSGPWIIHADGTRNWVTASLGGSACKSKGYAVADADVTAYFKRHGKVYHMIYIEKVV